jgi:urease accessory protein
MGYALIHQSSWEQPKPEAFMHRNVLRLATAAAAAAAASLVLVPAIAWAHPGHDAADLVHGFMHPLGGIDHILAMVAVGLLAARMGGRALWLVPASFVLAMAAAGLAGMTGVVVTGAEAGIALSVLVLGAMIAFGLKLPVAAVMGLVGFFAVFHGYAHGAEMPATASGLAFGAGFVAATALLHGLGIALGLAIGGTGATFGRYTLRLGGSAIMLAGAVLLIGAM